MNDQSNPFPVRDTSQRQQIPSRERPAMFHESNRPFWDAMRRFLIYLLKELDRWYGWRTFENVTLKEKGN